MTNSWLLANGAIEINYIYLVVKWSVRHVRWIVKSLQLQEPKGLLFKFKCEWKGRALLLCQETSTQKPVNELLFRLGQLPARTTLRKSSWNFIASHSLLWLIGSYYFSYSPVNFRYLKAQKVGFYAALIYVASLLPYVCGQFQYGIRI